MAHPLDVFEALHVLNPKPQTVRPIWEFPKVGGGGVP